MNPLPRYHCRGSSCPGLSWKASHYPHPTSCVGPTDVTRRGESWPTATDAESVEPIEPARISDGRVNSDGPIPAPPAPLSFTYTNHRGETGTRRVALHPAPQVRYIDSPHHGPSCVLTGFDLDRGAMRDFALDHVLFHAEYASSDPGEPGKERP